MGVPAPTSVRARFCSSLSTGPILLRLDHRPPDGSKARQGLAPLDPAPVGTGEAAVRGPPLAFAAIEHDPHVAPVLEMSAQLVVSIEPRTRNHEDQHARLERYARPTRSHAQNTRRRAISFILVAWRRGTIGRSPPECGRKSLRPGSPRRVRRDFVLVEPEDQRVRHP